MGAPAIDRLFSKMCEVKASDLHLCVGMPPLVRKDGEIKLLEESAPAFDGDSMWALLDPILPERNREEFERRHDTDFAYEIAGLGRFRSNIFMDRKGPGAVFRVIPSKILTAEDLGSDDAYHGARCVCSPPPRDKGNQEVIWNGLADGLFTVFSSDHAPFNYDAPEGKKPNGEEVAFRHIPNGIPGLETRLPLLYSEGVLKGRLTLNRFVELTATNPAKAYGLHPRKGTIAIGSDADLVVWDEREVTVSNGALHHAVDYTPYEGMRLAAWPALTLAGGEVVWDGREFHPRAGRGRFLRCGPPTLRPAPR